MSLQTPLSEQELLSSFEDYRKSLRPEQWRMVSVSLLKLLPILRFQFISNASVLQGLTTIELFLNQNTPGLTAPPPMKTLWATPENPNPTL